MNCKNKMKGNRGCVWFMYTGFGERNLVQPRVPIVSTLETFRPRGSHGPKVRYVGTADFIAVCLLNSIEVFELQSATLVEAAVNNPSAMYC